MLSFTTVGHFLTSYNQVYPFLNHSRLVARLSISSSWYLYYIEYTRNDSIPAREEGKRTKKPLEWGGDLLLKHISRKSCAMCRTLQRNKMS